MKKRLDYSWMFPTTKPGDELFDGTEIQALRESNAIEGVIDEFSLADSAMAWAYLRKQKKLTIEVVLETHRLLMIRQPLEPYQRGAFRLQQVWVGGREGVPSKQIYTKMGLWLLEMNNKKCKATRDLHVIYEQIHPFIDGNGRTGRMFMNWQLLQLGEPILVIKHSEKRVYYDWFKVGASLRGKQFTHIMIDECSSIDDKRMDELFKEMLPMIRKDYVRFKAADDKIQKDNERQRKIFL